MTDRKPPQGPPPVPSQEGYPRARPAPDQHARPEQRYEQDPYATRLRPPADDPRLHDPRHSSYAQAAFDPPQRQGYPSQHAAPQQHGHPQHIQPQQRPQHHGMPHEPPMRPKPPRSMPPPYRDGPPDHKPGGFGLVKGLLAGLAAVVVLIGAGFAYLVYALPPETVRDQIAAAVKSKTGRDLTIAGGTSFTLYPSLGITMRDVTLSPPPGVKGKPLVTMTGLDVSVQVLPLLQREVVIERLVLRKPVFELYSDAAGRKSWEFALASALPVRLAQAATTATDAPSPLPATPTSAAAGLEQLTFGDVRIEDGTLRYADARTGAAHEASAINVQLGLAAINQPLTANGDLVWKGEKLDIDGELNSVKSILEDKPAKAVVTLAAAPLSAKFDGSVAVSDAIDLDGAVSAKSASLRALAAWLGTELPPASGFGPLEAKGQIRVTGKVITLAGANLALDGASATGQVSVDTAPERPFVKAVLQVSELDLNKYMRPEGTPPQPPKTQAKPVAPAKPQADPGIPARSIEDLLAEPEAKPGPKVQGYTQRAGWSNEPIDVTSLGAVDADAKLAVGRLLFQDLKVGQSQLTVTLKNRVMKSNFDDVQLYGGRGRGFITLDGSAQKSASIGANLAVDGINAEPFLQDAAGFDKLTGKGKLTLAVAGQGANQRQMVETLNGKADFTFTDGAVKGINVAGMVRGISQGKLTGLGASPSEKTDFSELGATWTITNGIAQNQDLHLNSPLMRLTGAGNVMLPQREVDYMLRPKLVSSLSGQGGQDEQGLEIPVRVSGSWDKLSYTPDLAGVMKDPNKALDTVKQLGKQLGGKDTGNLIKGILGGGNSTTQPTAGQETAPAPATKPPQQKLDAKGLLDQFLKPQ